MSLIVLFMSCAAAAMLGNELSQFAALLAGYALVGGVDGSERERFSASLDSIARVSLPFSFPIYFALIGYRLVFGKEFSFVILAGFFVGSTLLSLLTSGPSGAVC